MKKIFSLAAALVVVGSILAAPRYRPIREDAMQYVLRQDGIESTVLRPSAALSAKSARPDRRFLFNLPGKPGIEILLDRDYWVILTWNPKKKMDLQSYALVPKDDQSSLNLSIGEEGDVMTEDNLRKEPGYSGITTGDGTVAGQPAKWRRWCDDNHLYSDCATRVPGPRKKKGYRIVIQVTANSPERRAALEQSMVDLKLVDLPSDAPVAPGALSPTPEEKITLQVDTIPADAEFISSGEMNLKGYTLGPENTATFTDHLEEVCTLSVDEARQRGANLIVYFSAEHGLDFPLSRCQQPLRVMRRNARVMQALFRSDSAGATGLPAKQIHFTTNLPAPDAQIISHTISLPPDAARVGKAAWVYRNLPRFIAEAEQHGLDTIALRSTSDIRFDEVPLPGCDEPVRISTRKPELTVMIYRSSQTAAVPSPAK